MGIPVQTTVIISSNVQICRNIMDHVCKKGADTVFIQSRTVHKFTF